MICGGITAGAITQPWIRRASVTPPFNPLTDIPDLARLMLYNFPYPQKSATCSGDNASNGDLVSRVCDQLQPGPSQYDDQTFLLRPTKRADGLEYDAGGVEYMAVYNNVIQAGLTAFTFYGWGTLGIQGNWFPLAHVTDFGAIYIDPSFSLTLIDDSVTVNAAATATTAGSILARVGVDGSGNVDFTSTGSAQSMGSNTSGTVTLNVTGISAIWGQNGGTDNRHLGQLVVARNIVLGSPEDLNIRTWISTNYPGYAL